MALLNGITQLEEHLFWPDNLDCKKAFANAPLIAGHQQLTDLYLLALARANQGIFATFDRGVPVGKSVEIL